MNPVPDTHQTAPCPILAIFSYRKGGKPRTSTSLVHKERRRRIPSLTESVVLLGRQLMQLYGVTHDKRYAKAAELPYLQLMHQPRTSPGGFRHKQR